MRLAPPATPRSKETRPTKERGDQAEAIASHWLQMRGLRILQQNYRQRYGEIDIIAWDGATLAFIEIRSRREKDPNEALASVSPAKQRRIIHTAQRFLSQHPQLAALSQRFDILAIAQQRDESLAFLWQKAAFSPQDQGW